MYHVTYSIPEEYFSTPLFPIQYKNLRMNSRHKMAANSRQQVRKFGSVHCFYYVNRRGFLSRPAIMWQSVHTVKLADTHQSRKISCFAIFSLSQFPIKSKNRFRFTLKSKTILFLKKMGAYSVLTT